MANGSVSADDYVNQQMAGQGPPVTSGATPQAVTQPVVPPPETSPAATMPAGGSPAGTTTDAESYAKQYLDQGEAPPIPPAPPIGQWPGILAQTFLHSAAPSTYPDFMQGAAIGEAAADIRGEKGQPVPTMEEYYKDIPPAPPRYGGALGYGEQIAGTAGTPLGAASLMVPPLALPTLAGDVAGEFARQHGATESEQIGASALGGMLIPGGVDALTSRLATRSLERTLDPANIAAGLAKEAGVAMPGVNTVANMKHEAGKVVQDAVGDYISSAPAPAATARAMKARAAKAADQPVLETPGDKYLRKIDEAPTPSKAVDAALSDPDYFKALPENARKALGYWHAVDVRNNPQTWLKMDPAHQEQIVPDPGQRAALTTAAQRADATAKSKATPFWSKVANTVSPSSLLHLATHHILPSGASAGAGAGLGALGNMFGLVTSPHLELASAAAGTVLPWIGKQLYRNPSLIENALTGSANYYAGQDGAAGP